MFVQSANFVKAHLQNASHVMDEVAIYGQEKTDATVKIAKMNLAIHGLSGKITQANSFYEDVYESVGKFDFVLANPPFNVKGKDKRGQLVIDPARLQGDPRYYLGLPLTGKKEISNANYMWIQIFVSALKAKGRAGFVMANSATDAGNAEKEIRKKLVTASIVDVVISTPSNMFLTLPFLQHFGFLIKEKRGQIEKTKYCLSTHRIFLLPWTAHIIVGPMSKLKKLLALSGGMRGKGYAKYADIKGRCKAVTLEKIIENDYSLNPGGGILRLLKR